MAPVPKPIHVRRRTFLKQWRVKAGLTLEKAAERLEVHHTTIMRIESGKSPYDQDILERMALAYGCDVTDLLEIDPLRPDPPRLVYDRLRRAPKDLQIRAIAVMEALLKTGT